MTSDRLRLLTAIACTWPITYASILFPSIARWAAQGEHAEAPTRFLVVLIPHLLTIGLLIFAWGACVRFVARSSLFSASGKVVWIALLSLGNLLALPIFFWVYMWRRPIIRGGA